MLTKEVEGGGGGRSVYGQVTGGLGSEGGGVLLTGGVLSC